MLIAGCGGEGIATASALARHGDPLDPGERPTAEVCRQRLTGDIRAATRIRAGLRIDGIPATDAAARTAAADPAADVATLGIPLTPPELAALRAGGVAIDSASRLVSWIHIGEPEQFGGIWIDPPGGNRYVVAVVGSDPSWLALARCLDQGVDVHYVSAGRSLAAGQALQERISADTGSLQSSGIGIVSVAYSEKDEVVVIGVTGVTEAIRRGLTERYGDAIRVEEQAPLTF